ncbi:MAG: hypothetical protein A4E49_02696 [Methanosaeta sp. PtaU1.Bin112]|nr:MAG: hypothetical protein A4E49_02696 [Methanosaeta sp. PtaU1.Bin112]
MPLQVAADASRYGDGVIGIIGSKVVPARLQHAVQPGEADLTAAPSLGQLSEKIARRLLCGSLLHRAQSLQEQGANGGGHSPQLSCARGQVVVLPGSGVGGSLLFRKSADGCKPGRAYGDAIDCSLRKGTGGL